MHNKKTLFLEELIHEIHEKLEGLEKLLQAITTKSPSEGTEWLTTTQLCQYLPEQPSKSTIYKWVSKGRIPFHRGPGRLRFNKAEIDNWLENDY